jgi:hypothetical protein
MSKWNFNLTVSTKMQVYKIVIGTNVSYDVPLRSGGRLLDVYGLHPNNAAHLTYNCEISRPMHMAPLGAGWGLKFSLTLLVERELEWFIR